MRSPDFLPSCRWKDHKMRKMLNDTQKASIGVILTPCREIVLIHIRTPKRKRNISFFSSLFLQLFLTQKLHFWGARKDLVPFFCSKCTETLNDEGFIRLYRKQHVQATRFIPEHPNSPTERWSKSIRGRFAPHEKCVILEVIASVCAAGADCEEATWRDVITLRPFHCQCCDSYGANIWKVAAQMQQRWM